MSTSQVTSTDLLPILKYGIKKLKSSKNATFKTGNQDGEPTKKVAKIKHCKPFCTKRKKINKRKLKLKQCTSISIPTAVNSTIGAVVTSGPYQIKNKNNSSHCEIVVVPTTRGHHFTTSQGGSGKHHNAENNVENQLNKPQESLWRLACQIFLPFLLAGFGNVAAGLLLDKVQYWPVFVEVSAMSILVPSLLGLKGNLEMTMASRLSTHANMGKMETLKAIVNVVWGNVALVQCQATVVSFLASVFAITVSFFNEGKFSSEHALLLCASSLLTANTACFLLALMLAGIVTLSHKANVNPDNIATPIAASLGDVISLGLLASISEMLYTIISDKPWVCAAIIVLLLILSCGWAYLAYINTNTKTVLYTGWWPIITAMLISSGGGYILEIAMRLFRGLPVFQPVISGIGGNLVGIQASRMATSLHQSGYSLSPTKICISPCSAFSSSAHGRVSKLLLAMVLPGQLIFATTIGLINAQKVTLTFLLYIVYLSASLLQVFFLLYLAHCLVYWLWNRKIDPDNSAIPILTAVGDLLGCSFLTMGFLLLNVMGDPNATMMPID